MIRIIGAGNSLITGLQGAGKSHFIMSQIVEILADNELQVYLVNVDGVKINNPNLHIVDASFSWVNDAPDNSVIIYDEAGMIDRFNNSNSRINSSEDVQRLTMARHQGKTIVFVAQDSSIVHPAVRKLLTRHFHFSNPYNDKEQTHCFVFPQVQDRLDGQNKYWQNNAIEEFKHPLDPDIFPLYKSVDDGANHIKKKQVNKKAQRAMRVAIACAVLIIPAIFIALYFGYSYSKDVWGSKTDQETVEQKGDTSDLSPVTAIQTPSATQVPEGYIDDQNEQYMRARRIYVKRLPPDYDVITTDDNIRPSAVIQMGNKCRVYNAHGDLMTYDLSECKDFLTETGKIPKSRTAHSFVSSHDDAQDQPVQVNDMQQQTNPQAVQGGITSTDEYIFADKSKTEPIFN
ncbi:zonular occludens toxin domain-containing protein [Moraxella bovis]|uniref:Zonula occludens toxin n=1 Tax=Moraxella bovis TaxID=476 RepID=A0A378PYQ9_MORBO|nr:zonular occludens toxin domain-containing protein [Moraxella bovis]STY93718.1 Zonula occludens toxin [Moraxella bovis]STY93730.1 Zonula occludens toxin [Moraxella bovis]STY93743.1 Zonula occludens toxin [Moraxella bovis]